MVDMECHECGQKAQNAKGLSYHVRMKHSMSYADYLVKNETCGVWPTCGCGCGQKVKFLCGKFCAHVGNHSHIGKTRSEDVRRRIAESMRGKTVTPESNAKRSASMTDYHSKNDNVRVAVKKHLVGSKRPESSKKKQSSTRKAMFASGDLVINRAKISDSITRLYLEGGFAWATGQHTSTKTGATINYRSSWELQYAQLLDNDETVKSWRYEPFSISYEIDGLEKRYVPDFLVEYFDDRIELVEVKPPCLTETKVNVAKREAARLLCDTSGWRYVGWSI